MTELVWQDPPPAASSRTCWPEVAEQLRCRPTEWALVRVCPNNNNASVVTRSINVARFKGFVEGQFEAVSRKVDGEFRVYARFLGAS